VKNIRIEFHYIGRLMELFVPISIDVLSFLLWNVLSLYVIMLLVGIAGYHLIRTIRTASNDSRLSFIWTLIWSIVVFSLIYTANAMLPILVNPNPNPGISDYMSPDWYYTLVFFGVYPSFILLIVMIIDVFRYERLAYTLRQQQELS